MARELTNVLDVEKIKPHKGMISDWRRVDEPCHIPGVQTLNFYIAGKFLDHPQFAGKYGTTSYVVSQTGDDIETLNSRYTLVGRSDAHYDDDIDF